MDKISLLDCTLRDGGYINNWNWGYNKARDIITSLTKANVDIVEVGFLRNIDDYNKNVTVCNRIEELRALLPKKHRNTMFSAMAMRSNYDVCKLSEWKENGIDMIRITMHDYDLKEGMEFAREVQNRGYKLSINPINIMGYSDDQILGIVEQVNKIMPYQFSIVDTFGSMKRRDLDRIVSLVDHNLDLSIRVGLHLHENMAQSYSLAQAFLEKHLNRDLTVDASLMGMGRVPGNLSIELIAEYLNEYFDKNYDIDYMMDAIHDYIEPIKEKESWGYTPTYFLSAKYNLHRNYAEYYLDKGDLTNRDINHILSRIQKEKMTVFDSEYAENVYQEYQNNKIDDEEDRIKLKERIRGKNILILAPGKSLEVQADKIREYIQKNDASMISLNFVPKEFEIEMAFFSNSKRLDKISYGDCSLIVTSNLELDVEDVQYRIDYNGVSGAFRQGCNSLILLLNLLGQLGVEQVAIAGADGYTEKGENYFDSMYVSATKHDREFNQEVGRALKEIGVEIEFVTDSEYEKYM